MPGTTDTVKAILTPGEFVIRKEAVDMIGAPMLNMINNMPEKGGHSNIDKLIEKATMANMKGMYGGGMVQAGPKPMGTGGMVDAYAGGGMVMDQYGHGGKVKNQMMMGYEHGGKAHGNLKPVPDDNPGLAKLPEKVRNKMGYMQKGGMAYIDPADSSIVVRNKEQSKLFDRIVNNVLFPSKSSKKERIETVLDMLNNPDIYGMDKKDSTKLYGYENLEEFYKDILEPPNVESKEDSLMGMMYGGKAKKKKKYGYQEGGAVQDDAMMLQYLQSLQAQQANPFVPFDQRPPSSGEMMSPIPSGMEQGDMMRIIRDEREVLDMEDAELLRQKGKNFFEKLRLDSLQSKILDSLMQLDSGRIERLPADTSGFTPIVPMFKPEGMGI